MHWGGGGSGEFCSITRLWRLYSHSAAEPTCPLKTQKLSFSKPTDYKLNQYFLINHKHFRHIRENVVQSSYDTHTLAQTPGVRTSERKQEDKKSIFVQTLKLCNRLSTVAIV